MLSFFDQFQSPAMWGIPLSSLAILTPVFLIPAVSTRWVTPRLMSMQDWFLSKSTKELMLPINPLGQKWALLFTSLLVFLVTLNMLGLLPYTFTPTTQLSMNLAFAMPLWLATVLIGLRNQPMIALAHLVPQGTPAQLIPVLIIIETVSLLIRPLALGVRLTANLTAGHLLIQLTATAALVLMPLMLPVAILTLLVLFLLTLLEVGVALIQAYVFVLLLCLYLEENV